MVKYLVWNERKDKPGSVGEPVEDEDPERDMFAVGAGQRRVRNL